MDDQIKAAVYDTDKNPIKGLNVSNGLYARN